MTVTVPVGAAHKSRDRGVVQHLLPLRKTAADLLPGNADVQVKAANFLLLARLMATGAKAGAQATARPYSRGPTIRTSRVLWLTNSGARNASVSPTLPLFQTSSK